MTEDWFGTETPVHDLAKTNAAPWAGRVGATEADVGVWQDEEAMEAYCEDVRGVFRGLADMLRKAVGEPKPMLNMDAILAWRERVAALPERQRVLVDLAEALDDAVDESFPGDEEM